MREGYRSSRDQRGHIPRDKYHDELNTRASRRGIFELAGIKSRPFEGRALKLQFEKKKQ